MAAFVRKPYTSSWIFYGPSGQGKTSMGLAIADEIDAELHHIPSQRCTVEVLEDVCRVCHHIPHGSGFHLVLCDEADSMTAGAGLHLLSKMDATAAPPKTIFIYTANSLDRFESRFHSRCRKLEFKPVDIAHKLPGYLRSIAQKEIRNVKGIPFERIAKESGYNIREALMKLEVLLMSGHRPQELKPNADWLHEHYCKSCELRWECNIVECKLPYHTLCKTHGGSVSIYQERARKAVATMKRNRARELRNAARRRPRRK